jgi:hypothetical protein
MKKLFYSYNNMNNFIYRHQIRIGRLISNSYSLHITQKNKNQSLIYLFFGYIKNKVIFINIKIIKNN